MKRSQKNGAKPIDEHDQPTEPINFTVSPYAPTVTSDDPAPDAPTMPAQAGRPFPQQQVPPQAPLIGAYPFLPPAPNKQNGNDGNTVGGMAPPENAGTVARSSIKKRRRLFPALVGLVFVVIQLLLLARFVLSMIRLWDGIAWVNVFYSLTSILIWPVQVLLQQIPLPFAVNIEISTLLAILLYGLFSRILVRCLKLFFRSR